MRRVITAQFQSTAGTAAPDTYFDKVIKYVPADIVAAWVAVGGLIRSAHEETNSTLWWICLSIGVSLTAGWTWKQTRIAGKPAPRMQIAISTIAFMVWTFALGPPFDTLDWYRELYGSLFLILFTLTVGLFQPD